MLGTVPGTPLFSLPILRVLEMPRHLEEWLKPLSLEVGVGLKWQQGHNVIPAVTRERQTQPPWEGAGSPPLGEVRRPQGGCPAVGLGLSPAARA